jgi:hypothetical protein
MTECNTIHEQREMLTQRIFSLALGYEDLNDQQTLRDDPTLQVAAGKLAQEDSPLASPPTLCRLENRINRKALVEMSKLFVDHFLTAHEKPPKEIVLDFDATDELIHGQQKGRFYQGYYKL